MLKTMKYKKQIEEGKQLIDVNQQLETFPVTRKNQTEPIIVWTWEWVYLFSQYFVKNVLQK